ncbi:MAG: hypothetical protein JO072_09005, partial [Parafilimonas sp.]|nr:hypothetical protein [Parafilimonas sp.]
GQNIADQNVNNQVQNVHDNPSANEAAITDKAEDRKASYVRPIKLISKQAEYLKQQNKFPVTQITLPSKSIEQKTTNTNPSSKPFDPSVINNVPEDNTYNDPVPANNGDLNAANARPVRRRTNGADIGGNTSIQKNQTATIKTSNIRSGANYVNVPEYVEMTNGSADLKIQNVSGVDLDLVVVDVQYFDASGRFHKGETLYLHNLKSGKNIIVKTPKDINAQHATAKVSLVSSDANNLYVVGDN